jgi:5-(carboxyamino)imidazole ribonucleotide mutase
MKKVLIVMGSDSDLPIMQNACKVLDELQVPYSVRISSAHRAPQKTAALAAGAMKEGFGVIIAGAGGAAHLAGVIAAETSLPVIAVPIKSGALVGFDALLAMVQMPAGIPAATVAIDGARNAGILAAQILAAADDALLQRIVDFKAGLLAGVEAKDAKLQELGVEGYLAQK